MRIALVNMPFASAARPSLALGLLQSLANRHGHTCRSKYFNTLFSRMMGSRTYRKMADYLPVPLLAGEWIFSQAFYGQGISSWSAYERDVLSDPLITLAAEDRSLVQAALGLTEEFLQLCLHSCDWSQYDMVGFTSTFEQTMASMCLARLIKQQRPEITIVMGGANFESVMAPPFLRLFPFVDYICHGEADVSFLQLCRSIEEHGPNVAPPSGFVSNHQPTPHRPAKLADLDSLPYPDFDDFFRAVRHSDIDPAIIPLEAARGCWWGEKSHCTFCGLNGESMQFRQKSARRVYDESAFLAGRYQPRLLSFSDNILSREHMKNLLPQWALDAESLQTSKFFEVKSNMVRDELVLLRRAGVVNIQPGIESLVESTLRIMGKGVSPAHNVAVLRWCMELGIEANWNLLYGFPGEDPAGFQETAGLIANLSHIRPPQGCFPIRVDRFSPNYERWREHGFRSIKPLPAYRHIFAAGEEDIARMAYFFDYEHERSSELSDLAAPMRAFWTEWQQRHASGAGGQFVVLDAGRDGSTVLDARFNRPRAHWRLTAAETDVMFFCDQPIGVRRLPPDKAEVLDGLLQREIVLQCGNKLVTAPLIPESVRDGLSQKPATHELERESDLVQLR